MRCEVKVINPNKFPLKERQCSRIAVMGNLCMQHFEISLKPTKPTKPTYAELEAQITKTQTMLDTCWEANIAMDTEYGELEARLKAVKLVNIDLENELEEQTALKVRFIRLHLKNTGRKLNEL